MTDLTHLDEAGAARMVDVSAKPATAREAVATGIVHMAPATVQAIIDGAIAKGDVLAVARIAGIQGAKRTSDLVPLCHPLAITSVAIDLRPVAADGRVEIEVRVKSTGPTGVEIEALTAVSVAALTMYDMVKGIDRGVVIGDICLREKSGGRSGLWRRGQGQDSPSG
ncbi:MAG: cyclic pyranopterin monophosphate synthase MoaC [Nitrospirota bacterium]|jgi:cyclic pyranopterin phosphate synthase